MGKIIGLVNGNKTYLIALGLAGLAVAKYFVPELPIDLIGLDTTGDYGLVAGLLWAWRSAMKKTEA